MGHKIHPTGFRTGIIFDTKSVWYADKRGYAAYVLEDAKIRKFIKDKLFNAGLTKVEIKRSINSLELYIHISRPGVVIGRGGSGLEQLKKSLEELIHNKDTKQQTKINIHPIEVKAPDLSAVLVADRIIGQIIHRYPHRRAVNQAIEKVMTAGAKGIKIQLSGRIGGAEIARREVYKEGQVPSQTLRANIDYYDCPAMTSFGNVGVKVWIYTGEIVE